MLKRMTGFILSAAMLLVSAEALFVTEASAATGVSGDFKYETLTNDTVRLTGYTGSDTEVEVPAKISDNGTEYTVVQLLGTFNGCADVESITIPDTVTELTMNVIKGTKISELTLPESVTKLGDLTFTGVTSLEKINLPNSLTYIGGQCFNGCTKLDNIEFGTMDKLYGIHDWAFIGVPGIKGELDLPGLTTLGSRVFENCANLTGLNAPKLVKVGDQCFQKSGIKSFTIPAGIVTIGANMFDSCLSLETINVDAENRSYKSIDGVLYSKDGKTLYILPPNNSQAAAFKVPDGVEAIADYGIYGCKNLVSLTLPEGLKSIGTYGISHCQNSAFNDLYIPDTVTTIGEYGISYNTNISTLHISENLTAFPKGIFKETQRINPLNIPDSVETIADEAFYVVRFGTDNVSIPASVTSIGNACTNMANVKTIKITQKTTSISEGIFNGTMSDAKKLTIRGYEGSAAETLVNKLSAAGNNIEFEAIPTKIYEGEGYTLVFDSETQAIIDYTGEPEAIAIPAEIEGTPVTRIEARAFENLPASVTEITIPENITWIGGYAFDGAKGLAKITIPQETERIGVNAFRGVSGLTICGYGGSAAAEYAANNNITFQPDESVVYGDDFEILEENGQYYAVYKIEKLLSEEGTQSDSLYIISGSYRADDNSFINASVSENIQAELNDKTGLYDEGFDAEHDDHILQVKLPLGDINEGDEIRLFFWESLESIKPVRKCLSAKFSKIVAEQDVTITDYMGIYDFPEELVDEKVVFDGSFKKKI